MKTPLTVVHCICRGACGPVNLEEGVAEETMEELRQMGHTIQGPLTGYRRTLMGRGHVITRGAWWAKSRDDICDDKRVWWAGSDSRADGHALGY